ncbi:terminase small subunit [Oribacterium sinus]|uniref:Terminase small subunit n=1 Tax=Oribacterium sinus TaxID=237576 RepID=A0A930GXG4_9FIRM|nr:terminase small subunit [Oribacterium sinus]MBF1272462.1 terminase small subunit [Oribacterium sinus]
MKNKDDLTDKQKKFIEEYLIDMNGTRAYRAVYPSVKKNETAAALASRLLTKDNVKKAIEPLLENMRTARMATATEVMEYLTSVMRGESTAEVVVVEGLGDGCSEARRFKKAPDEKERLRAAELLGKRFGLFKDKVEVSGIEAEQSKLDSLLEQMGGGD